MQKYHTTNEGRFLSYFSLQHLYVSNLYAALLFSTMQARTLLYPQSAVAFFPTPASLIRSVIKLMHCVEYCYHPLTTAVLHGEINSALLWLIIAEFQCGKREE